MKKKTWILSLLGLLIIGGGAAVFVAKKRSSPKEDKRTTLTLKKQTFDINLKAFGNVEPGNRVEIKPPVSGSIDSIKVEEGQFIKEGTILAWMSSTDRSIIVSAVRASSQQEMKQMADVYKPIPIVAPISGTIIANNVKPAQTISGGDVIFAMSDKLVVRVLIDEVDIAKVKKDLNVDVSIDAVKDSKIAATVKRIGYDARRVNNVNKYVVDIDLKEAPAYLRSGMTANLNFHLNEKPDALVLPRKTLHKVKGSWTVDLVTGKDEKGAWKTEERKVKTGDQSDDLIEITEGLKEGEQVIVPADEEFQDKTEVKVSSEG